MLERVCCLSSLLALFLGCAVDEPRPSVPTWEEFRSSVYQDPRGAFVVDGDLLFWSEAALRAHYDAYLAQTLADSRARAGVVQQPLIIRHIGGADARWPIPINYDLTFCIDADFGGRLEEVRSTVLEAAASWSALAAVRFPYVFQADCDARDDDVVFNVSPVHDAPFYACSFFPDEDRTHRELLIDETAFTTSEGGRDLQGILRHELGHVLGFGHEHLRLDPPCVLSGRDPDPTLDDDAPAPLVGYRELTEYDVDSVMHWPECRPSKAGGYRQTELDRQGVLSVYGSAPLEEALGSLLVATAL